MMKKFKTLDNNALVAVIGGRSEKDFNLGRTIGKIVKHFFGGGN